MWIKEECVLAGRLATLPSFMRAPSFCPHNRFLPSFCPHSFKSIFCPHKMTSFFNLLSATLIELKIFAYGELNILEYALINLKFDLIFALINWKRDPKKCPHNSFLKNGKPAPRRRSTNSMPQVSVGRQYLPIQANPTENSAHYAMECGRDACGCQRIYSNYPKYWCVNYITYKLTRQI